MKIALICRSFDKNSGQGVYKMAGYLYENLKKYSDFKIEKIEAENNNPYFFDLIECPKKVLNTNSDVYHFLMPEVCLPLILSKKIRENSIVTIHDTIVYKIKERKFLSEKYIKLMYNLSKKAKLIITPSWQSKKDILNFLRLPEDKVIVLPWGVDLNLFKPFKHKKRKEYKIVGYVGGLGKRKNIEWLLYLAKEFNELEFRICGKGPQLNKLKKMAEQFKLTNVKFLGFVPEERLPIFYNSIDVFIFPSLYEGFSIPLLEAMACGVPYIISTDAGIGEILPIYKIRNFDELGDLLAKIKEGKVDPLKEQRRWIINNKLIWKGYVKKLVEIYENFS